MEIEFFFSIFILLLGILFASKPDNFLLQFFTLGDSGLSVLKHYGKGTALLVARITGFVLILLGLLFLSNFI